MRPQRLLTTLAIAFVAVALASAATPKKKKTKATPTPPPAGAPKSTAPNADGEAARAKSLLGEKRYAEAEAAARSALAMAPTHDVAVAALGEALVSQRKFDDAVQSLSAVIAARKEAAYAYFWRGQAYSGKKQADRMISDFETFLKLQPDAPEAPTVRHILAGLR